MTLTKLASAVALFAVAGVATAANQPFTATNAVVTLNPDAISSTGYTVGTAGAATLSGNNLTIAVESVGLDVSPGPIDINFAQTSGIRLTKANNPSVTLSDFTFDVGTNTLYGDLLVGSSLFPLLNLNDQSLLTATTASSSFGGVTGTNITSSATTRTLGLDASGFVLSQGFRDYLTARELNPDDYTYIADLIGTIKIGTVSVTPAIPEPSTYALMGVGLIGLMIAKKRKVTA